MRIAAIVCLTVVGLLFALFVVTPLLISLGYASLS